MPRARHLPQSEFPYHVSARSINRDWFGIPLEDVWEIMGEQLFFIHHAFNIRILAFVLMSNHFHLLVRTPDANLSEAMAWFMRESSRELTRRGNRINQAYGGRYFRSVIATNLYYFHAYKYIYTNPVRAGICDLVESYMYCTIAAKLGFRRSFIPLEEDTILLSDVEGTLAWLNRPPLDGHWEAVRNALRHQHFKLAEQSQAPHELEKTLL